MRMPSTVIASLEYDKADSTLIICFISGSVYEYYQVPEALFNQFKQYRVKGVFYNRYIKGKFEYTKRRVDKL